MKISYDLDFDFDFDLSSPSAFITFRRHPQTIPDHLTTITIFANHCKSLHLLSIFPTNP